MPIDPELRRERRLRRKAQRQGLQVVKSRCRNVQSYEYGGFMVLDAATNYIVAGGHPIPFFLDLDGVERELAE